MDLDEYRLQGQSLVESPDVQGAKVEGASDTGGVTAAKTFMARLPTRVIRR